MLGEVAGVRPRSAPLTAHPLATPTAMRADQDLLWATPLRRYPTSSGSLALVRSAAAPVLTHNVCEFGCRLFVPFLPSQVPSSDGGKARAKRKNGAPTRSRPRSSHAEFQEVV